MTFSMSIFALVKSGDTHPDHSLLQLAYSVLSEDQRNLLNFMFYDQTT